MVVCDSEGRDHKGVLLRASRRAYAEMAATARLQS